MPKECVFYEWKGGAFYCNVAQRDINDEIVHRYCWTYYSEECPLKKRKTNGKRRKRQWQTTVGSSVRIAVMR